MFAAENSEIKKNTKHAMVMKDKTIFTNLSLFVMINDFHTTCCIFVFPHQRMGIKTLQLVGQRAYTCINANHLKTNINVFTQPLLLNILTWKLKVI